MSPSTDRQHVRQVLTDLAAKAKATLGEAMHGRIDSAVALVLQGDVTALATGEALVGSASQPDVQYRVNGACTCIDFAHTPSPTWCKHRLARAFQMRLERDLAAQDDVPDAPPVEPAPAPAPLPHGLDPRHVVTIQGTPFVRFSGLLALAHQRGLQSLTVEWTFNDAELSLAHAVALFPFGAFQECGDSTPESGRRVGLHWRRMSLTRAKARCLRDALGIDLCSLEEME